jgi:hypothetical protein
MDIAASLKAEILTLLGFVLVWANHKFNLGFSPTEIAAGAGLLVALILKIAHVEATKIKWLSALDPSADPAPGNPGTITTPATIVLKPDVSTAPTAKILMILVLAGLVLAGGGCSGLRAKTASDLQTASEQILPEYLGYIQADPKLDQAARDRRVRQVQAFQQVLKDAQ